MDTFNVIKIDKIKNNSLFFLEAALLLYAHHLFDVRHISFYIQPCILVPDNSFIMLVKILLFQHYSSQICNLSFLLNYKVQCYASG